jgi:hypothetical protein
MTELKATCRGELGDQSGHGTLVLQAGRLRFNGAFSLELSLAEISTVRVQRGRLEVVWSRGHAAFALGRLADQWAAALGTRRSLLDKLGVKPGAVVLLTGIDDLDFRRRLHERGVTIIDWNRALATYARPHGAAPRGPIGTPEAATSAAGASQGGADVVFLGLRRRSDLQLLERAEQLVARDGAVWTIYARGDEHIRDADVLAAARRAGLLDVKVVRFSDTHTARRFVIPPARR